MASAKLIAYTQASIVPFKTVASDSFAYLLPGETHCFRLMFDKIFENFGSIKTYMIHELFY